MSGRPLLGLSVRSGSVDSARHAALMSSPTTIRVSERNLYGGMTRFVGAGTPLYTRPARSNLDWWHGQKKPPSQSAPRSAGATSGRNVGEQPRCVQMPTATQSGGLIERVSFLQYAGCCGYSDFGSASLASSFGSVSSICGVRLTIQTTFPRHSTSIFCPGSSLEMSISTGAPAAFARSLGKNDITKGVAAAATPTPPTTLVAPIKKRRLPWFTVPSAISTPSPGPV